MDYRDNPQHRASAVQSGLNLLRPGGGFLLRRVVDFYSGVDTHEENVPVPIGMMAGPMTVKIFELTDPETPMDLCRWHSASQSTRRALRNIESQGLIWACSEFGQRQKFWRAVMSV